MIGKCKLMMIWHSKQTAFGLHACAYSYVVFFTGENGFGPLGSEYYFGFTKNFDAGIFSSKNMSVCELF